MLINPPGGGPARSWALDSTSTSNRWYPKRGISGALAQLEEHLLCKQRVRGSSPLSSTWRSSRFGEA